MYEIKVKSLENSITVKNISTVIDIKVAGRGPIGPTGATGQGVPAGGLMGQFLMKSSDADYDDVWSNLILFDGYGVGWTLNVSPTGEITTVPTVNTGGKYEQSVYGVATYV